MIPFEVCRFLGLAFQSDHLLILEITAKTKYFEVEQIASIRIFQVLVL